MPAIAAVILQLGPSSLASQLGLVVWKEKASHMQSQLLIVVAGIAVMHAEVLMRDPEILPP
jgi:hypothetical protein